MTTLRRELRTKLKQVLDENGIYTDAIPPMPSIVDLLADAALGVAGISATQSSKRYGSPVGNKSLEMAKKRLALGERIEAQLGITPDHKQQAWVRVLDRIIGYEEDGDTLEKFVKWYKAGTIYDRPKTFQIVKNPNILIGQWKEAMDFCKVTAPIRNEDGSINAY